MPALQVRDLPQPIYEQLAREAAQEHRSLAQQTTSILERHFHLIEGGVRDGSDAPSSRAGIRRHPTAAELSRRTAAIDRLNALPPVQIPEGFPSVSELLAEEREGRDDRFGL